MDAFSAVYGAAATLRRRWYAGSVTRTRQLAQPVISMGNLRVGGTGKTPAVACLARLLLERGEQPAILSRGYARLQPSGGVTVVSDRERVLADVAHAGDEPMLLARALPGIPVLVCADRYLAGRRAETAFGVTVHLLDDGFQHVKLARDLDLLLVDLLDLDDRVLPAGRLREPLANAAVADAVIVPGVSLDAARALAERLGVREAFAMSRSLGTLTMLRNPGARPPRSVEGCRIPLQADRDDEAQVVPAADASLFAVAGIARPERFFDDLRRAGFNVAGTMAFGDHHAFRQQDIDRIVAAASASGAAAVVTTEKDAVRFEHLDLTTMPFAAVPLQTRIEPVDGFASWVMSRLEQARARHRPVR